jgi:NOL1/NOP2/sun family putative RNA methylase
VKPTQRSLPDAFLQKLRRIIPSTHFDKVVRTFQEPKPTTFRINSLRTTPGEVKEILESSGFKVEAVHWLKGAFILRKGRQRDLEETALYQQGRIYVQNLSSMVPPLALAPQRGDKVLDLTAAPGSKTTQLSTLMGNEGSITANDNNPIRVEKLKANVERQGCANVTVLPAADGGLLWKDYPEGFDKVLLDAPCSSEGRFLTSEPGTYGYWKEDTNRKMARDQRRLFKSALRSLKLEGTMVYSTCTFSPEENEGVLQWALETYPGDFELLPLSVGFSNWMPGLAEWEDNPLDPSIRQAVRVLPDGTMEGFFLALLRKKRTLPIDPPSY